MQQSDVVDKQEMVRIIGREAGYELALDIAALADATLSKDQCLSE